VRRKPSLIAPVAVFLRILGLAAGYVGAYVQFVETRVASNSDGYREFLYQLLRRKQPRVRWFDAIHWLDKRLRPRFWEDRSL
jgi:hypothetical protein